MSKRGCEPKPTEYYSKSSNSGRHELCVFREDGGLKDFALNQANFQSFMIDYITCNDSKELVIGEKINVNEYPLIVPMVFSFASSDDRRKDPVRKTIPIIVDVIVEAIKDLVDIDDDDESLLYSIGRSAMYEKTRIIGKRRKEIDTDNWFYTVQFHYIKVPLEFVKSEFYERLVERLAASSIIKKWKRNPVTIWDQIIDMDYLTDYCPLYRSYRPGYAKTKHQGIFMPEDGDHIEQPDPLDNVIPMCESKYVIDRIIVESVFDSPDIHKTALLTLAHSGSYHVGAAKLRDDEEDDVKKSGSSIGIPTVRPFGLERDSAEVEESDLESAIHMISLISSQRFFHPHYWWIIGAVLYNITRGTDQGCKIWIEQTRAVLNGRNPGLTHLDPTIEQAAAIKYETFADSQYTLKTLRWLASIDNPVEYKRWEYGILAWKMEDAIGINELKDDIHDDMVARCFAWYVSLFIVFIPGKSYSTGFYRYYPEDGIWKQEKGCEGVEMLLVKEFYNEFIRVERVVGDRILSARSDAAREQDTKIKAKISKLMAKLLSSGKHFTYVKCLKKYVINHRFDKLKNSIRNILVTGPNTVEFIGPDFYVRDNLPEDYYTRKSGKPYDPTLSRDHPGVIYYHQVLKMYFPNKQRRMQHRKLLASLCVKGNPEKSIHVHIDPYGDSGKTTQIDLQVAMFGSMDIVKMETTMITGSKKEAGAATPHITRLENARSCVLDEGDSKRETIKSGLTKIATGNDARGRRKMREDEMDDVPQTNKTQLVLNTMMPVESNDPVVQRRFIFHVYTIRFVSGRPRQPALPETKEEQLRLGILPEISDFSSRIVPYLAKFALWQAVQDWPVYYRERFNVLPPCSIRFYNTFWMRNDVATNFIFLRVENAYMIKDGKKIQDPRQTLNIDDMYHNFKSWFNKRYPRKVAPDIDNFFETVCNSEFGMPAYKNKYWYGVQFVEDDDKEEEGIPTPLRITRQDHLQAKKTYITKRSSRE